MNALNILSGLGSGSAAPSPTKSRSSSLGNIHLVQQDLLQDKEKDSDHADLDSSGHNDSSDDGLSSLSGGHNGERAGELQTPDAFDATEQTRSRARKVPRRVIDAVIGSLLWLLHTAVAPIYYIAGFFVDEHASMSFSRSLKRLYQSIWWRKRRKASPHPTRSRHSQGSASQDDQSEHHPSQGTRSKTAAREPSVEPSKRSIRIKLHSDTTKDKKSQSGDGHDDEQDDPMARVATALKSPSSGASAKFASKLRYPSTTAVPRPLVPRRQPSFTTTLPFPSSSKKTLIIDLDETLIHSMAKGGRMSTGHMVEVRIAGPIGNNGHVHGPQVPILYYVHERPYCHEFLRKVCKWYNLIVFTASVQEYADPVIDWLERERAYFSGRYYRQHCTYRNGAYIKDLSHIEPDLSKVMILDNSPMSYIFHEDNAVPIEGWISDPTDHDLLHLVPFFEGLQYVTDVRALLALRLGQADKT